MKFLFALLLLVVVGVCGYAYTLPDEYRYTRSLEMSAYPDKIFLQLNNLQNFNKWSPWAKMDPNAKIAFEGPVEGNGAIMRWAGNMQVGEGSMTITSNTPNKLVKYQLDFLKPMKGTATTEITLETVPDNQTRVTWSMYGTSKFHEKVISVVMNCEKMISEQFDNGLFNLKTLVETPE